MFPSSFHGRTTHTPRISSVNSRNHGHCRYQRVRKDRKVSPNTSQLIFPHQVQDGAVFSGALQRIASLFLLSTTTAVATLMLMTRIQPARSTHRSRCLANALSTRRTQSSFLTGYFPVCDCRTARKQRFEHCFCFVVFEVCCCCCRFFAVRMPHDQLSGAYPDHRYPYA